MDPESGIKKIHLRVLHDLLPEALNFPHFAVSYSSFVRTLRERLHPVGKQDVRLVETASGHKFKVDLGDRLGCDVYYGYYQELFDARLFLELLGAGAIVLDIGANFGLYSVFAAAKIGTSGAVHSFEPNKYVFDLLKNNVSTNNYEKIIHCHNVCIGDQDGETDFYISQESSFSGIGMTGRAKLLEKVKIRMRSIDSLVRDLSLPGVDAIKIDVEGYEFAVLRGALELAGRSPEIVIMMEISAKNLDEAKRSELIAALTDLYKMGFRGWMIDSNIADLLLVDTPERAAVLGSANLFLVRTNSSKERQLRQAYKKLLADAFHGIAKEIGLSADVVLDRNVADPLNFSNLHSALLVSIMRERDALLTELKSRLSKAEVETTKRLDLNQKQSEELAKRDAELGQLREGVTKRDAELGQLREGVAKRDAELGQLREGVAKRDAELGQLREGVAKRDAEIARLNVIITRLDATLLNRLGRHLYNILSFFRKRA